MFAVIFFEIVFGVFGFGACGCWCVCICLYLVEQWFAVLGVVSWLLVCYS